MSSFNFRCLHCNQTQTVTSADHDEGDIFFTMSETRLGHLRLSASAICCSNPECRLPTVMTDLKTWNYNNIGNREVSTEAFLLTRLLPDSSAKPQPEYIPKVLREDYLEACRIRDLSPKASATLSRRCLQGMIRDFAKISKGTLFQEIETLKQKSDAGDAPKGVSDDSIEALHHIRSLGNIGAHMEKDIDVIIPVDPSEAQVLLEIIETLFDEWYVARETRQRKFAKLKEIANEKEEQKLLPK